MSSQVRSSSLALRFLSRRRVRLVPASTTVALSNESFPSWRRSSGKVSIKGSIFELDSELRFVCFAGAFWGIRPPSSKLSKKSYRFRPVVLATKAFGMVEEEVIASQVGNRNAGKLPISLKLVPLLKDAKEELTTRLVSLWRSDPQADLLGEVSWKICHHVFSHASWFLMRAEFSEERSLRWEEGILAELETLRMCEKGTGGFAQLHLVYAVKKEHEV